MMKLIDEFPFRMRRQARVWLTLCVLLFAQLMGITHAVDLDAHDAEVCEICLATASSDGDDFIESAGLGNFFYHAAASSQRGSFAAKHKTLPQNHPIRAPPH